MERDKEEEAGQAVGPNLQEVSTEGEVDQEVDLTQELKVLEKIKGNSICSFNIGVLVV